MGRSLLRVAILCLSNYSVTEVHWVSIPVIETLFHNMLLRVRQSDVIIAAYRLFSWNLNQTLLRGQCLHRMKVTAAKRECIVQIDIKWKNRIHRWSLRLCWWISNENVRQEISTATSSSRLRWRRSHSCFHDEQLLERTLYHDMWSW